MTTITRSNPQVGYLEDVVFQALGFTQIVRAGDTVYISGVAPFVGGIPFEVVGVGSMSEQITFELDVIEKCLASAGLTLANLVQVTVYATDMPALLENAALFAQRFGADAPTSTWLGTTALAHPDQLVEITCIAVA